ncbi:hypothetical protein D3C73_1229940 [compost metagenome]
MSPSPNLNLLNRNLKTMKKKKPSKERELLRTLMTVLSWKLLAPGQIWLMKAATFIRRCWKGLRRK